MKKKIFAILLFVIITAAGVSCSGTNNNSVASATPAATPAATVTPIATVAPAATATPAETPTETAASETAQAAESAPINTIISIGPANSEILSALGVASKIIATDSYSVGIPGIQDGLPQFDMMGLDIEQLIKLAPDLIITTSMLQDGVEALKPVEDAGIRVEYVQVANTIQDVENSINFIAGVVGKETQGGQIVAHMNAEIDKIKAVGDTITDKKTVYFELDSFGGYYPVGGGSFLNEMIEIIGAANVFADQASWFTASDETIIAADPDVILTSENYVDNSVDQIKARSGWDAITAVMNGDVYYIDANSSSRPSQNIIEALKEMAAAVYPDYYK